MPGVNADCIVWRSYEWCVCVCARVGMLVSVPVEYMAHCVRDPVPFHDHVQLSWESKPGFYFQDSIPGPLP